MGWLNNQVVLITGGASGIGLAVVERFVVEGAKVGVMDRTEDAVKSIEDKLGDKVVGITGDVRSLTDNEAAVKKTVETFGKLDVFIGNAGIWDYMVPLMEQEHDNLESICDEIFSINVKGYLLGARAAMKELKKNNGSLIFTVSSSGFYTGGGGPIYVASKHAVVGMIKQLAYEMAPDVRVNGVAPGATITNLGGSSSAGQGDSKLSDIPDVDKLIEGMTPMGFASEPEDHSGLYTLLASRENSRYVTGTIINSDGGIGFGKRPG